MPSTPVAIDFETFYDSKQGYSLTCMPTWQYLHDPRFHAYWVAFHGEGLHYSGPVESAPWDRVAGVPLASHNASFDHSVLEYLQEKRIVPAFRVPSMYDTADAVAYLQEQRSLEAACRSVLGISHSKGVRTAMDGRPFASLDAAQVRDMAEYGGKDAEYCWRLWKATEALWPSCEWRLSSLNRERGIEGLRIDARALKAAIDALKIAHFNLIRAMPWVPDQKPLSPEAIREQGRKDGIPVPASLKLDDPAAVAWEEEYAPKFRWVSAVRGMRRVNTLLKKLETWYESIRPDGTAPFQLKYFGAAATGRFSGAGGFNLQNLPRNPAVLCQECGACYMEDVDEGISDDYEIDSPCPVCSNEKRTVINIRGMILAPEGRKLVVADYSQIEARLLLWRAGDTATLDQIRAGFHIYEAYARAVMGWTGTPGTLKSTDKLLYATCKATVLGGGYGAGRVGFRKAAKQFAKLELTLEQSQAMVEEFRTRNPKIPELWQWHNGWFAVAAAQGDATHEIELESGRRIRYFNPRWGIDKKGKRQMMAETVRGDKRWTRSFWGGKLTENDRQGAARDVMRDGVLACEDVGIRTHFTVHDELVTSVPEDQAQDALAEIREILPQAAEWARECPLGVDAYAASRYYVKE